MKKRFLAAILAAAMVVCLLPTTALTAGESGIQLGTSGLKSGDEVYFGQYSESGTDYDVPWIVLNTNGFLLSKYLLGNSLFRTEVSGYYKDGTLNSRMNDFYNGTNTLFTSLEHGAIAAKANLDCADGGISSPSVDQAHLYPLSFNEAIALTRGSSTLRAPYITNQPAGSAGCWWWLRSSITQDQAYLVTGDGGDGFHPVSRSHGVRPAFNLNLASVLFTSPAVGGKASGAGALNPNSIPSGTTAWKLTLDDSVNRGSFAVSTTAIHTPTAGGNEEIVYSGAKIGTPAAPEYLSAMIVDSNNTVLYYGRLKSIAENTDTSGTQTIAIPALTVGNYTLKIFNEQYNGDYKTDYSSGFKDVSLTVRDVDVVAGYGGSINSRTYQVTTNSGYVIDQLWVDGALIPVASGQTTYTHAIMPMRSIFATFAYTVNFNQPANGSLTVARADGNLTSGTIVRGGDMLTITGTPDIAGQILSLTINGTVVTPTNNSFTYTVGTLPGAKRTVGGGSVMASGADISASFAAAPATAIAFSSLAANGSATETTTELTLTFDKDIPGLAASDITVTNAAGGTLTKESGTGVYKLTISGITVADNSTVNVAVAKDSFSFTPANKDVAVRVYTPPLHTHSWAAAWSTNDTHHWHECTADGCPITENSSKDNYGAHVYTDDSDTTCNTCNFTRTITPPPHTHSWAAAWSTNDTHHWHECTADGCPVTENIGKDSYGAHVYTDDSDTTCNTCNFTRTITPPPHTHSWAAAWSTNDTHHWHECTTDGCPVTENIGKGSYGAHIYTDDSDTTCNTCNFTRTITSPSHTHSWAAAWSTNDTHHWHGCTADGCPVTENSSKGGYGAHVYTDDSDTTCNTCGYTRTITLPEPDPDPVEYGVTQGPQGRWTKNSASSLGFTFNAPLSKFMSIAVDNNTVSADKYTKAEGSTIITLKASCLEMLSVGTHTLRVNFTDGYAQATFTVSATVPTTGDNSLPGLWAGILMLVAAGLAASVVLAKRKRKA